MTGSTEVAVHTPSSITELRRSQFSAEQVQLIRATVAADCNDAELALFLETCARHELDPFIKEVWAIRWKAGKPVQTVVSKDGLLKVANRCTGAGWANQPGEYTGCFSQAVFENDHFDFQTVTRADGTKAVEIDHRRGGKRVTPLADGEEPGHVNALIAKERGALVGAYAAVSRRGHSDYWFVASREEYNKTQQAWSTNPTAMMVKVAEAMALRKAFPIAGVVGEGELDGREPVTITAGSADEGNGEIRWPEDEELAGKLREAFDMLGWRRAKIRAKVNACESLEDFGRLLGELHNEADLPADGIADAEVVPS